MESKKVVLEISSEETEVIDSDMMGTKTKDKSMNDAVVNDEGEGDGSGEGSSSKAKDSDSDQLDTLSEQSESSDCDYYTYGEGMTDAERLEQDHRNFGHIRNPRYPKVATKISLQRRTHIDSNGDLWFTEDEDNAECAVWERATFHHWIRKEVFATEDAKGSYIHRRKRGSWPNNRTSFLTSQQQWGTQRASYAPIMFEYERLGRRNQDYELGRWYHRGLLVIDFWLVPLQAFRDIPAVLSSRFEGEYMEPIERIDNRINHHDFRARMPPFVEKKVKGARMLALVSDENVLAGRMRRFRERAGAITWNNRKGSKDIKGFLDQFLTVEARKTNNTRSCRDLTRRELNKLRGVNLGKNPERRKKATTDEARANYLAEFKRKAEDAVEGSESRTKKIKAAEEDLSRASIQEEEDAGWESYKSDESSEVDSESDVSNEAAEGSESRDQKIKAEPGPEEACSKTLTQEGEDADWESSYSDEYGEANSDSDADDEATVDENEETEGMKTESQEESERDLELYLVPDTAAEQRLLQRRLAPTRTHYTFLTGNAWTTDPSDCYIAEYLNIQSALDEWWVDYVRSGPAPELIRIVELDSHVVTWNLDWVEEMFGAPVEFDTIRGI